MLSTVVVVLSLIASGFLGYWIHRALHLRQVGPFHRAHMEHHLKLYPVGDLTSETYRKARWYNRGPFLFTPPFVALVVVMLIFAHIVGASLWSVAVPSFVFVGFGYLNDRVHDSFHLRRHWLQRFSYYRRIRRAHFVHHVDMSKNFGIVSFEWDRAFETSSDGRDR